MEIQITYCSDCYNRISGFGELVINTYEKICEYYVIERIPIKFNENDKLMFQVLRLLENKGFILTACDQEPWIKARPQGYLEIDDYTYTFCIEE